MERGSDAAGQKMSDSAANIHKIKFFYGGEVMMKALPVSLKGKEIKMVSISFVLFATNI